MGKIIIKYSFLLKLPSQIIVILFSLEILIIAKLLWSSQQQRKNAGGHKKVTATFFIVITFPFYLEYGVSGRKERVKNKQTKKACHQFVSFFTPQSYYLCLLPPIPPLIPSFQRFKFKEILICTNKDYIVFSVIVATAVENALNSLLKMERK